MNFNPSKANTELIIIVLLVGALPMSLYLPGVPFVLLSSVAVILSLLVYIVYLLGEKDAEPVKPEANIAVGAEPETKPEPQTIQEILNRKLESGILEEAIDKQFDKMVSDLAADVFSSYGGIASEMKTKLKEQMSPYIEQYDYSQHGVKLEMMMNELVTQVTKDQTQLITNTRTLMGLDPIKEITATELFDKFCKHIGEEIDTSKLEIDTDDEPSYSPLTASFSTENTRNYSSDSERKILTFHCKEDETLDVSVTIHRWTDLTNKNWHIWNVSRPNKEAKRMPSIDDGNLVALANPVSYMRDMDDLEIFLIKLNQDRTAIVLDETTIEDDEVEVAAEPEYTLS